MLISLAFDMFAVVGLDGGDSNIEVDIDQSQLESSSVSLSDSTRGLWRVVRRFRASSRRYSGQVTFGVAILSSFSGRSLFLGVLSDSCDARFTHFHLTSRTRYPPGGIKCKNRGGRGSKPPATNNVSQFRGAETQ